MIKIIANFIVHSSLYYVSQTVLFETNNKFTTTQIRTLPIIKTIDDLRFTFLLFFAQNAVQNFSDRRFRQAFTNLNLFRYFIIGQILFAVFE